MRAIQRKSVARLRREEQDEASSEVWCAEEFGQGCRTETRRALPASRVEERWQLSLQWASRRDGLEE